jgi:YHS domain-containing protein
MSAMQNHAPIERNPRTVNLGRGWFLPAGVLALILAVSYLPAHGVVGLLDVAAGTMAALGLVGASMAAPRWVRHMVTGGSGSVALFGSGPSTPDIAPPPAAGRRVAGVALGAAVSAAGMVAAAIVLGTADSSTAGHAVLVVALYANLALLLSNVIPIPPWPGWTLLLALLDRRDAAAPDRIDRAIPTARGVIVAEAAALATVAVASSDWMLLVLPALLIWQAWIQTAIARSDDLIDRYLTTRRLSAVARPLATTAGPDEPALLAGGRRPSARAVIAVMDEGAFQGAIGPRQVAAIPPTARRTPCRDAMIPAAELELLRADAPATAALPQLHRHGFAIVTGSTPLRYVEADDLLQRILMTAAVARAVRDRPLSAATSNEAPPLYSQGEVPMIISPTTCIDPVCGMAVSPAAAKSLRWKGRDYHFCEVACRETFREDPERWVEPMEHVDEGVSP